MPDYSGLVCWAGARNDTARLEGMARGRRVHVLGCGPSVEQFDVPPPTDIIIATNSAVLRWPCDIHLAIEHAVIDEQWYQDSAPYGGLSVYGTSLTTSAQKYEGLRSDDWWQRVMWVGRRYWDHAPFDEYGGGLAVARDQMVGGVVLAGIHLARILQGDEPAAVHTYGTEFMFPDGNQHWDGSSPYRTGTGKLSALTDYDNYMSTPFFVRSAQAILEIAAATDTQLIDHSGGLLSVGLQQTSAR